MRSAPYRTELGTGWVAFLGDRAESIVLPGGPAPAPKAEPSEPIAGFIEEIEAWFSGRGRSIVHEDLCERAGRTRFERAVYRVVSTIPPGATRTYAEVAAEAGSPGAARAVGAAMARNPFAPLIPCHRVVGSDGRLHGYAGGLEMKARLLAEEAGRG
jgi:methylated-DNA-[protein]-cysteine S-methyltransferase